MNSTRTFFCLLSLWVACATTVLAQTTQPVEISNWPATQPVTFTTTQPVVVIDSSEPCMDLPSVVAGFMVAWVLYGCFVPPALMFKWITSFIR